MSLLTEGRCPHCGEGLITAPKQAEPYVAWTTLETVSPSQTHDRLTMTHLPLPVRNDVILGEAGNGFFSIAPSVQSALEEEGLMTEDGVINVAHFLAFLAHGPVADRFRGMDEVLVALGNPAAFGARDSVSVRAAVRQAKAWTPRTATTVASVATSHGSDEFVPSGTPFKQLAELLEVCFSIDELQRLIGSLSSGMNLLRSLSDGRSGPHVFSGEVTSMLERRGRIDTELFTAILRDRPRQSAAIRKVASACGVSI